MSDTDGTDRYVTLAEWAAEIDRDETTVRYTWTRSSTFPRPVPGQKRRVPGRTSGPGADLYDRDELNTWRKTDGPAGAPAPLTVPEGQDPAELLPLGTIAGRLGLARHTVSQYRDQIEQRVKPTMVGKRGHYPFGVVVDVLNARRGTGAPHR